jgi:biopolymer transport protein ExbB/TolQ
MKMRYLVLMLGVCLTAGVAAAAEPASPAAQGEASRLLQFFAVAFSGIGGPFMWAIVLVSVFATTIGVERTLFLTRASRGDRALFDHVSGLIRDRRVEEARVAVAGGTTPFARVLRTVLSIRHGHRPEELQNSLDEAYLREIPVVQRRIPLLAVSANLATLLGLLGTIIGLILAFDALANVPAAQRTAALAYGIAVAMGTTGLGLIVAIPSLAAHGLLTARADRLTEEIESRLAALTNLMQEWNRTEQADPYEKSKVGGAEREQRLVDYVVSGEVR